MTEQKEETNLRAKTFSDMLEQAYREGREEHKNSVSVQLLELPEQIRKQSLNLAEITNKTEALRLYLEQKKNEALELVLSATTDGKPMYSNDKSRNMAVHQLLKENIGYQDNLDELSRSECTLRKEQIQLDYLQNQFKAYLAIAGMNGVR